CRHVRKGAFSTMRPPGKFRWSGSFVLPTIDRTGHHTKGTGSWDGLPDQPLPPTPSPKRRGGERQHRLHEPGDGRATPVCFPSAPPLCLGEGVGGRGSETVQGRKRRLLLS